MRALTGITLEQFSTFREAPATQSGGTGLPAGSSVMPGELSRLALVSKPVPVRIEEKDWRAVSTDSNRPDVACAPKRFVLEPLADVCRSGDFICYAHFVSQCL